MIKVNVITFWGQDAIVLLDDVHLSVRRKYLLYCYVTAEAIAWQRTTVFKHLISQAIDEMPM